ncbi:MAG: protein phosphatase 2C domain-containing protein [Deltaproteobacteria bacterium]|nr:protein phosphatase 2C domain-containing protein [Deltaproteobacteria bacterium]
MPFETASLLVQARQSGDDRLAVVETDDGLVLVVADGAGGAAGGAQAASSIVDFVHSAARSAPLSSVCPELLLLTIDRDLADARHGGQSTAVLAIVSDDGVRGASVGDSGALVVGPAGVVDLTRHQVRKPLLGDGIAVPVPFAAGPLTGTLVLASDGLVKYAPARLLHEIALRPDLAGVPRAMVDLARLRSGELQDDVAVVVCRAVSPS